jgi:hypothetical protein
MKTAAINSHAKKAKAYYAEVEHYYRNLSFKEAIKQGAEAKIPVGCKGKRTSFADHQYRIGKTRCARAGKELLKPKYFNQLSSTRSFEDVFKVTEQLRLSRAGIGLGHLWSYDTAQRISFNKGWKPNHVYLQAGAKKGALTIYRNGNMARKDVWGKRLTERNSFPPVLSQYDSYIIENILCVGNHEGWFYS